MDTFLDAEDLQAGLESGMPQPWLVFKDYKIRNGNIDGIGLGTDRRRLYRPALERELPSVLAKVNPEDEDQILDFVRRYGLLASEQGPEPLEWIQQQIRFVRLVLEMQECTSNNNIPAAERLYDQYDRTANTLAGFYIPDLLSRAQNPYVSGGLTLDSPLGWIRYLSCLIVNSNIEGVTRKMRMFPNGEGVTSYLEFGCLLDMVYWHIANAMENGEFKRCESCHAPFISVDRRQRFCPKRYGEDESRCAAAHRMRKHRSHPQ